MVKSSFMKRIKRAASKMMAFSLAALIAFSANGMPEEVYAKDSDGNIVIVIDPGHGGADPGKVGVNGVKEADANYAIAVAMKEELGKYDNVRVYFTRPADAWVTNTGRAMAASVLDADYLVSIHNNSGTETSEGAIVYTSVLPLYSVITADVGNMILNNLAAVGITNRGIETRNSTEYVGEDYYTIMAEGMRAGVPTVLIEHCFLSNPVDSLHVSNEDGSLNYEKINNIGKADAAALISYFSLEKNTAVVDSKSTVELEKEYSIELSPEKTGTGAITWTSNNENAVTVDENGVAVAVNSGTAEVMYSYADGTSGFITIKVNIPTQLALYGAIDPTFYKSAEEMQTIKKENVTANVIYSDGSVNAVTIETMGEVNYNQVGIQDIPITYGMLEGSVRVICNSPEYVPEVTSKAEEIETQTQPVETESQTETEAELQTQSTEAEENTGDEEFDLYMVIKILIAIIIVMLIGIIIYVVENHSGRRRRRSRRSRRGRRRRRF